MTSVHRAKHGFHSFQTQVEASGGSYLTNNTNLGPRLGYNNTTTKLNSAANNKPKKLDFEEKK